MDETTQRRAAKARADRLAGGQVQQVRVDVRASWNRAHDRGMHPDRHLPRVALNDDEVGRRRKEHPMATVWPVLFATLGSAAAEPGHVLFAGDAEGHLLRVVGDASARRAAERAHLVAGACWSEGAAGTNGVGTALALRKPFQVRGAEHYLSVAVDYTCTAAPIRNPSTGAVIGVVDVTCPRRDTRPLALPLLTAAARLAESHLAEVDRRRDAEMRARYLDRIARRSGDWNALLAPDGRVLHAAPAGWLPPIWPAQLIEGPATLPDGRRVVVERLTPTGVLAVHAPSHGDPESAHVTALGRDKALVQLGGMSQQLGARHSEMAVLLLANPDGLTAAALAREIYGADGKAGTIRVELARLRRLLGYRLTATPYRLTGITADFQRFDGDLSAARSTDLLDRYPGPLLPSSRAPGIIRLRNRLHERVISMTPGE